MQTFRNIVLLAGATSLIVGTVALGGAGAAEKKKADPKAACNSLTSESACDARDDCSWVKAVIDEKTKKQKRKAYCRSKPAPKKSKSKG